MSSEANGDAGESADGGYVHVPEGESDGTDGLAEGPVGDESDAEGTTGDEPEADGFGRRGWALTAVLFTCVLVIPGVIYVYPYAAGWFGLPFFATYLALPLVPAVLLGLVAVWSMTAATRDR
ncbi:hypothetical protein U4E84_15900 [Halorubrum sp. AD140]|uniref:hypothetical protein n=1 Tax=Halorubrum sp. AD140 TaxID=3050073 RepID=UPI002ACCF69E|nr:hypothetical protein [Halorubrum sp. AD140]MDZ5812827.1 hypothetical protein [Halorubrum sp. AD140]